MSYQEKNITVELMSFSLIMIYFLIQWIPMYRTEGLNQSKIFSLWITVIAAGILVTIISSILTNIALSIVHAIKTQGREEERFIEDERDKLIGLKGDRVGYIAFSIGVLISMLSFMLGQPALMMFSLLIFFSLASQIFGSLWQIYLYRRGA